MINSTDYNKFGPFVEDYRDYFDFTPLFEETILSITPSTLIFVVGLARVIHLAKRPKRLLGRSLQFTKLTAIASYAISQAVLVALWHTNSAPQLRANTAASSLSLLNAILFLLLSYLEHGRNIRPSSTLITYLFFSAAFDIIRLRTIWDMRLPQSIRALSTTSLVLKGLVLVLEAREKAGYLPRSFIAQRPEETSSILNRSIFYWLNDLLWKGGSSFLAPDKIYELDTNLTADHLSTTFIQSWLAAKRVAPKLSVTKGLLKTLKWQVCAAVIPRIVLLVLTICQPLLLQEFLAYLSKSEPKQHSIGRGLIAMYALLYFALAVSTGFYWHAHFRCMTMVRGCLISALNWQVTRLDLQAVGDPKAALSLMSSDMEQMLSGFETFHEFWANLLQAGFTGYLLYRQVGVAALMPVAIGVLGSFVASWGGKAVGGRQTAWMEAVERRINLLSSVLPSMKEVKMKGLTNLLETVLVKYRKTELQLARRVRMLLLIVSAAGFGPEFLSAPATFLVFLLQSTHSHQPFDATRAFTSFTLVIAMTQPINTLFRCLPGYMGGWASLGRVEKFLCAAEQEDFRDLHTGVRSSHNANDPPGPISGGGEAIPLTVFNKQDRVVNEASFAIRVTDGCFGWLSGKDVLHGINVTIPAQRLTFIVGPVASGKSTLCKAFLGETKSSKGRVDVRLSRGGISFCDQTPYLRNISVKDNIVGFCDFDESWYQTVIHAAALSLDITLFPKGDKTIVGANGANLSGGQRHKVAFARALYARNKIMILDDIFSGLDANSAEHIFGNAIGPGSLTQKHGMTVIFATHAIRYLPQSQHVIALGADGKVVQDGTYADLQIRAGYIQDLKLSQNRKAEEDQEVQKEAEISTPDKTKQIDADEDELDAARQQGDFSVYKYYFGAVGKLCTILLPFFGIITSAFFNLGTIWLKIWTDATSSQEDPNNAMYLGVYAMFQFLALIGMLFLAHHVIIRIVTRAGLELYNRILGTVLNAPLAVFSKTDAGSIINRFSQDMTLLDVQLAMGMVSLVYSLSLMIGQAVVIGVASPWTAASYPFMIFVFYTIQKFYLRTSRQMRFLDLEAKSPLYTYFLETTTGLATLRAFAWTKPNLDAGQKLLDQSQQPAYLLYMIQRWLSFVLDTVAACLAAIIAALAVTQNSSSGFAGAALSQLMFINLLMRTIVLMWTDVETSIGAVSRIKSFTAATPSEHKPLEVIQPPEDWPSRGTVQFHNISAVYDETNPDQAAVQNINLDIAHGEKIGLCGRSGSGKSSMILTLFHMLEFLDHSSPNSTILIDGIDIRSVPRNTLRSRLNVLPQHPFFLHGTIRQNLETVTLSASTSNKAEDPRPTSNHSSSHQDASLIEALTKVGLTDLITAPSDLDKHFDPSTLSHGQRQLFALAGALLRKNSEGSTIIVLDEVTSNLDHATDRAIQQIIRTEFAGCTIIAVAHRLNTIVDFDRIVVMQEGRIVEVGPPGELLRLGRRSAFGRMWEAGGGNHEDD